jgi:hypothetical protein
MGALGLANHLLNFVLPALALALLLPLCVRWLPIGRSATVRLPMQMLVLASVNVSALVVGLLVLGQDGKMLTYLGMAVAGASALWLLLGAWRR